MTRKARPAVFECYAEKRNVTAEERDGACKAAGHFVSSCPITTTRGDILIAAVESGISYWAETLAYSWRTGVVSATVRELEPHADGVPAKTARVTEKTIGRGLRLLADGRVKVREDIRKICAAVLHGADAGDCDATVADCIVQAAIFGDIIYG